MQRPLLAAIAALTAASLACSINVNLPDLPRLQTGPEQTFTVAEAAPAGVEVVDVNLNMAAGELTLTGGGGDLLEGEVRYNVPDWTPTLTSSGGTVTLNQGDGDDVRGGLPGENVVNDWDLKLGEDVPLNLAINAGAYSGELELGGVPLRRLAISDGASSTHVNFGMLNPQPMDRLVYKTGASSVTLTGLANANFAEMEFDGGAGDYELDFSGDLQRDATVRVNVGLCSLRISVPAGTNVRVEVDGGLHDVNTQGTWSARNDTYETTGNGPLLTIKVDLGAGSLTLVSQ